MFINHCICHVYYGRVLPLCYIVFDMTLAFMGLKCCYMCNEYDTVMCGKVVRDRFLNSDITVHEENYLHTVQYLEVPVWLIHTTIMAV